MGLTGAFSHVRIAAIAAAIPETCVPNATFIEALGESGVLKFEKMTGIVQRYHVRHLTTLDLAEAAAHALEANGLWTKETVDACLFVSQTPDVVLPATACILHGRLGLKTDCLSLDLGLGCSGFVYGLYVAGSLLEQGGQVRRVLLLGGDCISRVVAPDDAANQMLFGDAGFAAVLEYAEEGAPNLPWLFGTDGAGAAAIRARGFAPWQTGQHIAGVSDAEAWLQMDGLEVFNFTVNVIPEAIRAFCSAHGMILSSFAHFCFHQANRFILKQVAAFTGFSNGLHLLSMDRFGNTSSASIPLTLCEKREIIGGGVALLAGFGVGLSWGVVAYDFSRTVFLPVCSVKEPENV